MTTHLNDRAEVVLRRLIELYVDDGQPVGSTTLARYAELNLSPASIRNVMADLEKLGLIHSPHTSAGRIPTEEGYRHFVDSLIQVQPLSGKSVEVIRDQLTIDSDPQTLMARASDLLSELTQFAGVILVPGQNTALLKQVEFLTLGPERVLAILVTDDGRVQNRIIPTERPYSESELTEAANFFNQTYRGKNLSNVRHHLLGAMKRDSNEMHQMTQTALTMAGNLFDTEDEQANEEVILSGETNLLNVPDLCQIETLQDLFSAFKTKQDLLDLLDRSMRVNGISIFIGHESGYEALNDCSVVTAPYQQGSQTVGTLGVIGPTRMNYDRIIPVVDITARLLSGALTANSESD